MSRKRCSVSAREAYNFHLRMIKTGKKFAKFLPDYRLLGVDPGYLFISNDPHNHHAGLDLPEDVVNHLLSQLEGKTNERSRSKKDSR